ncbi:MAG TPA: TonB C-terminal domain-containing protein [Byssovorax sp.]|jgi:hypothetical protein
MSAASFTDDFRPGEFVLAVTVAVVVLVGGAVAIHASALDAHALAPEIDMGTSTPVRVIPVLDLDAPLLKLGGKRDKMKLPDRWVRQKVTQRVEERAVVTPKAGKTEKDMPEKDVKVLDAGAPVPEPDAGLAKQVDTPVTEPTDAGPQVANVDTEGKADGVKEGTETDPLKARAVDLYRARLAGWLSSKFAVHGSGLPPDELKKYKVSASVQVSADRTVESYTMSPSGNGAFDAAAKATLERVKGAALPPPPENYPDVVQKSISVTFVCREKVCD